jgi:hypothetical protein
VRSGWSLTTYLKEVVFRTLFEKSIEDVLGASLPIAIGPIRSRRLRVAFVNGNIQVNDALMTDADIEGSNDITPVIDSVLIPMEPKLKSIPSTAQNEV